MVDDLSGYSVPVNVVSEVIQLILTTYRTSTRQCERFYISELAALVDLL